MSDNRLREQYFNPKIISKYRTYSLRLCSLLQVVVVVVAAAAAAAAVVVVEVRGPGGRGGGTTAPSEAILIMHIANVLQLSE